jgi:hypothetical protein
LRRIETSSALLCTVEANNLFIRASLPKRKQVAKQENADMRTSMFASRSANRS